jgi:hypothetical protein
MGWTYGRGIWLSRYSTLTTNIRRIDHTRQLIPEAIFNHEIKLFENLRIPMMIVGNPPC